MSGLVSMTSPQSMSVMQFGGRLLSLFSCDMSAVLLLHYVGLCCACSEVTAPAWACAVHVSEN